MKNKYIQIRISIEELSELRKTSIKYNIKISAFLRASIKIITFILTQLTQGGSVYIEKEGQKIIVPIDVFFKITD